MNEWSPGGNYSRPVTPNQQLQTRSCRSHWDEQFNDNGSNKPLVVNIRAVAETRSRVAFQQRSEEDFSKTSLPVTNRIKKTVNGTSDPRFKRVICPGAQNDACVGTEVKFSRPASPAKVEHAVSNSQELNNVKKFKIRQHWGDGIKINKDGTKNQYCHDKIDYSNVADQEPLAFDSVQEYLKEVDKFSLKESGPDNFPKQSVSDCTINTRNTSFISEDLGDDYTERLHTFSSTTRMKKVQNWIAEQKPKLDKRQSVITVIGQTQGQSALSSAFQEIDQRRKLVKELDKYAIYNRTPNSEKDKEMNTLVAQINFLSPAGKTLHSSVKKCDSKGLLSKSRPTSSKCHEAGDQCTKHLPENFSGQVQCDNEEVTENATSQSASSLCSSNGAQRKSYYSWDNKFNIKGKIRQTLSRIPYSWLAYFMVMVSGTLCWYTYLAFQRNGVFIFDLFLQKPKATTWYEKISYWLWEIFRPATNYHRTSSWVPR